MESWTLPIEYKNSPFDKSIESINWLWNIFQWSLFDSIGQPSASVSNLSIVTCSVRQSSVIMFVSYGATPTVRDIFRSNLNFDLATFTLYTCF